MAKKVLSLVGLLLFMAPAIFFLYTSINMIWNSHDYGSDCIGSTFDDTPCNLGGGWDCDFFGSNTT